MRRFVLVCAVFAGLSFLSETSLAQGRGAPSSVRRPIPQPHYYQPNRHYQPNRYPQPYGRFQSPQYGYGYGYGYRGPMQYNITRPNTRVGVTVWPGGGNVRIQTRAGGFSFRF